MHGKNYGISQGTNNSLLANDGNNLNHQKFGFNILLETKGDGDQKEKKSKKNKVKENKRYESGQLIRIHVKQYTDNALIYQSILEDSIDFGTSRFFKSREISKKWLLDNCKVYVNEYAGLKLKPHIKKGARAEHINPRIKGCLGNLTYLELLESRNIISKNNEDTEEYRFTKLGRLVALLIKQIKSKHSDIDEIYRQSLVYYDGLDHSIAKFCSIFFRKCYVKDKKLFEIIVDRLVQILLYASNNKNAFLIRIKKMQAFYNHRVMWELFNESLDEFGKKSKEEKNMLLYQLKLEIEDTHEYKSRNLRTFEDLRCKVRANQNLIAIEGYCGSCVQFTPCVVSLLDHLESHIEEPGNSNRVQCPNCSTGWLDFETLEYL